MGFQAPDVGHQKVILTLVNIELKCDLHRDKLMPGS